MVDEVRIHLEGRLLEKFLDRVLREGISLARVRRTGGRALEVTLTQADAQRLLALSQSLGIQAQVLMRRGWPRLCAWGQRRRSLALGLLVCALILYLATSRVWIIEVSVDGSPAVGDLALGELGERLKAGTAADAPAERLDPGEEQQVLGALMELGIKPGRRASTIDRDLTALKLQRMLPQYAFVGIRVQGVRLLAEVVRELPRPELFDIERSRDLVAARDAVIERINVLAGTGCVKAGDTVHRGQLLVRGEERLAGEESRGVCALGEVSGRVWYRGEAQRPLTQTLVERTGRTAFDSRLCLMDWEHVLVSGERFGQEEAEVMELPVGGLFLPLKVVRTTHCETVTRQIQRDAEQVKREAGEIAEQNARALLKDEIAIVDKWIDYSMIEGNTVRAQAVLETRENIAVTRSALQRGGD